MPPLLFSAVNEIPGLSIRWAVGSQSAILLLALASSLLIGDCASVAAAAAGAAADETEKVDDVTQVNSSIDAEAEERLVIT